MNILTVIPARGGSKGIPGKNIRPLGGKPLIAWSIEAARQAVLPGEIYVNTDDEQIAQCAEQHGAQVFIRPAVLATDQSRSIDVVVHMLETLMAAGKQFDAVCLLQPTYPFRHAGMVQEAVGKYVSSGADSLISVLEVPHHYNPHWVFEDRNGFLEIATGEKQIIPRRQDLPKAWHRDGAIYITDTKVILERISFFGDKIAYYSSLPENYVNIDLPEDWELAERKLAQHEPKGLVY